MNGFQNTSEFVKNMKNNHQGAWTRGLSTCQIPFAAGILFVLGLGNSCL